MDEKHKQEWDNGVYGMFWAHTVYGGDDYDAMMYCSLDDPKVQTAGVRVQMPEGLVDFHMNVDRLGRVDPQDGQRAFDLNVQAARLFVAAPDLLEVVEMLSRYDPLEHPNFYSAINKAKAAIAKAKGGE